MSNKFETVVKITEEMGKKENSKKTGYNLSFKGSDGKKYNIAEKNMTFGTISIGKTYSFQGEVLDGEYQGKPYQSQWISSYVEVNEKGQHSFQQTKTDEGKNDSTATHEGWRIGQALNLGLLMLHQAGGAPSDKDYVEKWFQFADKALDASYVYQKGAGKFEVPF